MPWPYQSDALAGTGPVSLRTTVSLALPTPASKIKGTAVPSSLRIEKPAMWRSGLSPIPARFAGARTHGTHPHHLAAHHHAPAPHHRLAGHSGRRGRAHVDALEFDNQRVVRAP